MLRQHPFTRDLLEPHLSMLPDLSEGVQFGQDEIIFDAGERSSHFYLITSGCVCVEIKSPVYAVCIAALGPGEAFGWSSLLDHHNTVFQVRAWEVTTALRLDGERLLAACAEDPVLGREVFRGLLQIVAGRIGAMEARLGEFCGVSVPAGVPRPVNWPVIGKGR